MVSENNKLEQQTEKKNLKKEDSLRDIWDNIKCTNICILEVPEGEEKQQGIENLFLKK